MRAGDGWKRDFLGDFLGTDFLGTDETYPVKTGSVPMSFDSLMGTFRLSSAVPSRRSPSPKLFAETLLRCRLSLA